MKDAFDPAQQTILVVEDEAVARKNLEHILKKEGYAVVAVDSGVKGLELLETREFDLVITDLRMPRVDGMVLLEKCQTLQPYTEVIMITGYATIDSAVKAMKTGAYYYIAKPYRIDEVRKIAREALLKRTLRTENLNLKRLLEPAGEAAPIIGQSRAMQEVKSLVRQVATSDTNVLILGESGTGKELVAREIHRQSGRAGKRFVGFNCGSFTEELMTNELFGHEKGAFTGADKLKPGLIEAADGGTVFLDEVGDMPHSMQIKLLRVIQEKELLRVGGIDPVPVDVRFIAATYRDLKTDVEKSRFRQDLFYRLNVISLRLPPLAEREGDIPLLAYHFLVQKRAALHKDIQEIDREALDLLTRYSWPGNVRELENVIERAVALASGPVISADALPDAIRNLAIETYRHTPSAIPSMEEQEKHYIQWVLQKSRGNKTKAAQIMGIDRVSLWRKIKKYGISEG